MVKFIELIQYIIHSDSVPTNLDKFNYFNSLLKNGEADAVAGLAWRGSVSSEATFW